MAKSRKRTQTLQPRKLLENPIFPILAGAAATWFDAPGNVKARAIFLLVCWIFVSWDFGVSIFGAKLSAIWKMVWIPTLASVMGIVMLLCVELLYQQKLSAQQDDVVSHLTMQVFVPPNGDAVHSLVHVANGGGYDIGHHQFYCQTKQFIATGQDWVVDLPGVAIGVGGGEELKAGGHAETDICIPYFIPANDLLCADMDIKLEYVLKTQPLLKKSTSTRFVYRKIQGWNEQPESAIQYCPHTNYQAPKPPQ
jgi:hypothetical protein